MQFIVEKLGFKSITCHDYHGCIKCQNNSNFPWTLKKFPPKNFKILSQKVGETKEILVKIDIFKEISIFGGN